MIEGRWRASSSQIHNISRLVFRILAETESEDPSSVQLLSDQVSLKIYWNTFASLPVPLVRTFPLALNPTEHRQVFKEIEMTINAKPEEAAKVNTKQ